MQVLSGAGFSRIPTALTQGSWSAATLRDRAAQWGRQLRRAGVQVNLAPVADTVPTSLGRANAPIGRYSREFGHDPDTVGAHAVAFTAGMTSAKVAVAVKHFPGLGRVRDNTDTSSGVTDATTTRTDPYLQPFREAIAAGAPMVMMSSAVYRRIDADHPACFSTRRRHRPAARRPRLSTASSSATTSATRVRCSAGRPAHAPSSSWRRAATSSSPSIPDDAPAMYTALYAKAKSDTAFRAKVDAAALRVLRLKLAFGVLR